MTRRSGSSIESSRGFWSTSLAFSTMGAAILGSILSFTALLAAFCAFLGVVGQGSRNISGVDGIRCLSFVDRWQRAIMHVLCYFDLLNFLLSRMGDRIRLSVETAQVN